jgi:putative transposase
MSWQNGTDESFNGKFTDECLSLEWFRSRGEACAVIEAWRQQYNAVRPYSSLDYLTPHELKQQYHSVPNPAVYRNRVLVSQKPRVVNARHRLAPCCLRT